MKALILAAGLGSRLEHLTFDRPKALVAVHGRPLIDYQMESLQENGISEVIIVVGHGAEKLKCHMKSTYPTCQVTFIHNPEYKTTNSSYSFWLAAPHLKEGSYVHINCDIIFSARLLARLLSDPNENVIAIRCDIPLGDRMENVSLLDKRIVKMSIQHFPESVGKAFGLAKLGPSSTACLLERMKKRLSQQDKNQNCFGLIRGAVNEVSYYSLDAGNDILLEINSLKDLVAVEAQLSGSQNRKQAL